MLTNEAQPADQLSHYTPYSELEPFRIDPAVMGMFDPDYRDLVRGPGVFQLRDRWSLSGAGTHDGVGSPQPNAWAAPPIPQAPNPALVIMTWLEPSGRAEGSLLDPPVEDSTRHRCQALNVPLDA